MSSFAGLELPKKHQNPRQARLCCTSEVHEFGGVGDENGEKRESFRDSTVQKEHLCHPSPTESSFLAGRVAHVTSHSHTIDPLAEPKPRFFKKKQGFRVGGVPAFVQTCCTSEAHEFGGVDDENGEKRESFRDSTVQKEHLCHPSPTDILCSCVFVAQPTPHCPTQPGEATPNEPIWQFRGGGEVRFFSYFWVPEKIRGHHRHRGVRPCA